MEKLHKIFLCAASRGRYDSHGVVHQNIEILGDEYTNTITTVGKDNLIIEVEMEDENDDY